MSARGEQWLRLRDVMDMTRLGKTTIYRKMAANAFPRPVTLTEACVRWRESDVAAWQGQFMQKAG